MEKLEASYKKNLDVEQVWVYGNSFKSCLLAVVVPTAAAAEAWAKQAGVTGTFAQLCAKPEFADALCKDLQATGAPPRLLLPGAAAGLPLLPGWRCCCWAAGHLLSWAARAGQLARPRLAPPPRPLPAPATPPTSPPPLPPPLSPRRQGGQAEGI